MKEKMKAPAVLSVALCLTWCAVAYSQEQAVDFADWSDARQEQFLLEAQIGTLREVGTGTTGTRRAELSDGVVTHDAHVQTVDESRARFEGERGVELNFTDSYKFNIAAYRLDRLLGLNMVPVSVERRVMGVSAAVTWWVDNVQMVLLDFDQDKDPPPDLIDWNQQMYHLRLFKELTYNTDPNQGNFLITDDWKVKMIDFTRAFRINNTLRQPEDLEGIRIDRQVWDGLRSLSFETLTDVMGDLLTERQVQALLDRRDLIVQGLQERIDQTSEPAVIRPSARVPQAQ